MQDQASTWVPCHTTSTPPPHTNQDPVPSPRGCSLQVELLDVVVGDLLDAVAHVIYVIGVDAHWRLHAEDIARRRATAEDNAVLHVVHSITMSKRE